MSENNVAKPIVGGVLSFLLLGTAARGQTSLPATQPVAESPRSQQKISAELELAHRRFNAAVSSPTDISDPVRRRVVAPEAIGSLRTMVADIRELSAVQPKMKRRGRQMELQFQAFLSVLGDQPTTDELQSMARSKDQAKSLRGQAGQLLAKWVLAGKDQTAQAQLSDIVQSLDQAHPENEDLTFLTITLSQSTPSTLLEKQLLQSAASMRNPSADNVRAALGKTTTKP